MAADEVDGGMNRARCLRARIFLGLLVEPWDLERFVRVAWVAWPHQLDAGLVITPHASSDPFLGSRIATVVGAAQRILKGLSILALSVSCLEADRWLLPHGLVAVTWNAGETLPWARATKAEPLGD